MKYKDKILKFKKSLIVVLSIVLIALTFISLRGLSQRNKENGDLNNDDQLTKSPSATATISQPSPTKIEDSQVQYIELIESINDYASDFEGRFGIYFINLETKDGFGINETEPFIAANLIKLPIATLLMNKVFLGELSLTDTMVYDDRLYPEGDRSPGAGFIIDQGDGKEYSIRRIMQLAITISDNCAANMMIRALGGMDEISESLDKISANISFRGNVEYEDYKGDIVFGRHRTSAKDMAIYTRYLYDLWESNQNEYQPLIDDLSNTVFEFGIAQNLPNTVRVAHKIASNTEHGTQSDLGIIFTDTPYILSIMTEFDDVDLQREIISDISEIIYNFMNP